MSAFASSTRIPESHVRKLLPYMEVRYETTSARLTFMRRANEEMAAAKVFSEIVPERVAEIDMAVSKWRSEGGFRDSDLTL